MSNAFNVWAIAHHEILFPLFTALAVILLFLMYAALFLWMLDGFMKTRMLYVAWRKSGEGK